MDQGIPRLVNRCPIGKTLGAMVKLPALRPALDRATARGIGPVIRDGCPLADLVQMFNPS